MRQTKEVLTTEFKSLIAKTSVEVEALFDNLEAYWPDHVGNDEVYRNLLSIKEKVYDLNNLAHLFRMWIIRVEETEKENDFFHKKFMQRKKRVISRGRL